MSQEEFAEFLGFSSSAYGRLERNETRTAGANNLRLK